MYLGRISGVSRCLRIGELAQRAHLLLDLRAVPSERVGARANSLDEIAHRLGRMRLGEGTRLDVHVSLRIRSLVNERRDGEGKDTAVDAEAEHARRRVCGVHRGAGKHERMPDGQGGEWQPRGFARVRGVALCALGGWQGEHVRASRAQQEDLPPAQAARAVRTYRQPVHVSARPALAVGAQHEHQTRAEEQSDRVGRCRH